MNINKKQKQILVIGSTVADIIIHLDHLPGTAEDVNITRQTMSLGGCAYNVFHMIRLFKIPCTLFSPVGSGGRLSPFTGQNTAFCRSGLNL